MIYGNEKLLDIVTEKGSLLNAAIEYDQKEIALMLIDKNIDINKFDGIELLSAIKMNQNEVVSALLDMEIVYRDYNQKVNPLFYAVEQDNLDAVKIIINSKYKLFKTYNNEFLDNCTVLEWAKTLKKNIIYEYLKSTVIFD